MNKYLAIIAGLNVSNIWWIYVDNYHIHHPIFADIVVSLSVLATVGSLLLIKEVK